MQAWSAVVHVEMLYMAWEVSICLEIGRGSLRQILKIIWGAEKFGQTRLGHWMWDQGYTWLAGEKAWIRCSKLHPGEGDRRSVWFEEIRCGTEGTSINVPLNCFPKFLSGQILVGTITTEFVFFGRNMIFWFSMSFLFVC